MVKIQITTGGNWYTNAGNERQYAITFDLDDLRAKIGEDAVANMSFDERIRALNNMADAYVVAYVAKEGGISQEVARKKLAALSG